jgi:hypothetical protein
MLSVPVAAMDGFGGAAATVTVVALEVAEVSLPVSPE